MLASLQHITAFAGTCKPPSAEAAASRAAAGESAPSVLAWELPPTLDDQIGRLARERARLDASLDIESVESDVGLRWAKTRGVGLDGLVQLAVQMAYHRLTGRPDSVYQACSTQRYAHGRTEVIRSVTNPSKALAEAMCAGTIDVPRMREMVSCALDAHRQVVTACQRGHGHERHLLALYALAQAEASPMPRLFEDTGWSQLTTSVISTSGMRSPSCAGFAFGPVVKHGVGVGYLIHPRGTSLCVTSWHGQGPCAKELALSITRSIAELRNLLNSDSMRPAVGEKPIGAPIRSKL
jgi:carnitine O-acetyltransferase